MFIKILFNVVYIYLNNFSFSGLCIHYFFRNLYSVRFSNIRFFVKQRVIKENWQYIFNDSLAC